MFDPNYKLKHKPPHIKRLLYYKNIPPRMVGDPCVSYYYRHGTKSLWDQRCRAVYAAMMKQKRGGALWMWNWDDAPERPTDVGADRDDAADKHLLGLSVDGAI